MQIAGKADAAELDDARDDLRTGTLGDVRTGVGARVKTLPPALSVGAQFRAAFRWLAVLTAAASIVAVLLVGAISMGCYAVAVALGKIPPLREAYEFLSRSYDRLIERLGQKILRDARDTPALRLMVSLTLTAVPIFVGYTEKSTARRAAVPIDSMADYIAAFGAGHDAKYAVFRALCQDWQRYRDMMRATEGR